MRYRQLQNSFIFKTKRGWQRAEPGDYVVEIGRYCLVVAERDWDEVKKELGVKDERDKPRRVSKEN